VPRIQLAPGFTLIDQYGEKLTNEDLRGSIVLYNFTYTRCDKPYCDDMNETMQTVFEQAQSSGLAGIPFKLVTISFDPAHDTPEKLAAYADSIGNNPDWIFATTTNQAALKNIIGGGFEAYYAEQEDGTFKFDQAYVLVDGNGIIRGQYRYETISPNRERIARHIDVLINEIENSTGTAHYAYEAAHLFLCYAP
jgi:cytochrome oxidase Cu insertion factor (SCO1/SenC/PrrC family)